MRLYNEDTADQLLNKAWSAYRRVEKIIDCLEDAGLSVDGSSSDEKPMAGLFGVLTDTGDMILELMGVPAAQPYSDEAHMVLSHRDAKDSDSRTFPQRLRSALSDIADTAYKKSLLPMPDGAKPHEVTVCLTGGLTVYAKDETGARDAADAMPTGTVLQNTAWEDCANVTDAYEN